MDRYYFITVMAYQSVNNMGLELNKYVVERYDQAVVHANCICAIKADIEQKMNELLEKYPRCRPFELIFSERKDKYGEPFSDIHVTANKDIDKHVFVMNVSVVRHLNLECNLLY